MKHIYFKNYFFLSTFLQKKDNNANINVHLPLTQALINLKEQQEIADIQVIFHLVIFIWVNWIWISVRALKTERLSDTESYNILECLYLSSKHFFLSFFFWLLLVGRNRHYNSYFLFVSTHCNWRSFFKLQGNKYKATTRSLRVSCQCAEKRVYVLLQNIINKEKRHKMCKGLKWIYKKRSYKSSFVKLFN